MLEEYDGEILGDEEEINTVNQGGGGETKDQVSTTNPWRPQKKIKSSLLEYQREGSGWQLDEVLHLDLGVVPYTPLKGACYLLLPKRIKDKKAVLNIHNQHRKCFLWSVLAAKYPIHRRDQPHRVQHYMRYEDELNMEGIEFPVKISQVGKVERQNSGLSINIFCFENNELFPLYITKDKKEFHINLLLFSQGCQRHYCLIRNLDRLLSSLTQNHNRMFHYVYCLHGFVREDLLGAHEPHCGLHSAQKIRLPDENQATLAFKEVGKQLKVPFIVYTDFESI
ncbi:uncharacterized protein LOC116293254 [Actinia tenebrosa]|uniref:Uncharacterized protein LOC116293254 n=1 Tax=Actinia tenebrosa TaxID=6105 RepID=A0A6P8HV10_ACTTE|nr:uncharacterized protein LOC116293254 [Actinia tenebrosa]